MEQEIWKDIPNYEGLYKVSNFGRVKSIDRINVYNNGVSRFEKGKILTPKQDLNGYLKIGIFKNNKRIFYTVSRLVYASFIGGIELKYTNNSKIVIDHIDGNRQNNNIENLQKVTSRQNTTVCHQKDRYKFFSKLPGVDLSKASKKKFRSRIYINGVTYYLGCFKTEIEAHEAYQRKLKEILDI